MTLADVKPGGALDQAVLSGPYAKYIAALAAFMTDILGALLTENLLHGDAAKWATIGWVAASSLAGAQAVKKVANVPTAAAFADVVEDHHDAIAEHDDMLAAHQETLDRLSAGVPFAGVGIAGFGDPAAAALLLTPTAGSIADPSVGALHLPTLATPIDAEHMPPLYVEDAPTDEHPVVDSQGRAHDPATGQFTAAGKKAAALDRWHELEQLGVDRAVTATGGPITAPPALLEHDGSSLYADGAPG